MSSMVLTFFFIGYDLINPLMHKPNAPFVMFMVVGPDSETRDLNPRGHLESIGCQN